jgi:hypothetical protein
MDEIEDFFERHADELKVEVDVVLMQKSLKTIQADSIQLNHRARHKWEGEKTRLEKAIQDAFCDHFGLQRHRSVETFKIECLGDGLGRNVRVFDSHVFDHCTYYRKKTPTGYAFVIVSQPYGYDREHVEKEAKAAGIVFVDTDKWAWYYPGRANCFMLVFPPETVAKMRADRKYRKLHGISREEHEALKAGLRAEIKEAKANRSRRPRKPLLRRL